LPGVDNQAWKRHDRTAGCRTRDAERGVAQIAPSTSSVTDPASRDTRLDGGGDATRGSSICGDLGAAGRLVAPQGMPEAFYQLVDDPNPPLRDLAEHLKVTYGEDNARAMTRSEANALRAIIEAGGDLSRSHASGITSPALLLTGEHDPFCPPALVSELAEVIPRGEFVRVDEVGHDVHTARPQWLAETITRWLEQHRVDAASTQAMSSPGR